MIPLYAACLDAGLEIDHHESDLYVRLTPLAWEVLGRYRGVHWSAFTAPDGSVWADVPFMYLPFWGALEGEEGES